MRRILAEAKVYIVLLLAALVVVIWVLVLGSMPVSRDRSPVRVLITQGSSAAEVASVLYQRGLIRSPFVFRLTCRVGGSSGGLKPGVYEMNRTMGVPEIIKRLVEGQTLEQWVTVPEGYTARQIGDLLEANQLASSAAFVRLAIEQGYEFPRYTFTHGSNLEGYLFPDTYLVARSTNPNEIVDTMLRTFERKVVSVCRPSVESAIHTRPELKGNSFAEALHKILVLASMVEREAKVPRDRPLIAAVLWNRLGRNMRLEVDATVSYRPGESKGNKDHVLYSDLQVDSPYNTYRNAGLPPTPICNPGLAAVEAVLNPAQVDYLYYVARPDGSHVFSGTFEEHVKAKNAIRGGK